MSVDCKDVNPKDLMTRFEKFWVPPFGICVRIARAKTCQVLGSMRHSMVWSHLHTVFSVRPVPAMTALSVISSRSSRVKNLALEMLSGKNANMTNPHRKVATPRMINSHIQGWSGCLIWPTPYAIRLATRPPNEFPENQMPVRNGISSRVYYVVVMNMNAGVIVASATPSRKRTAKRPP